MFLNTKSRTSVVSVEESSVARKRVWTYDACRRCCWWCHLFANGRRLTPPASEDDFEDQEYVRGLFEAEYAEAMSYEGKRISTGIDLTLTKC